MLWQTSSYSYAVFDRETLIMSICALVTFSQTQLLLSMIIRDLAVHWGKGLEEWPLRWAYFDGGGESSSL